MTAFNAILTGNTFYIATDTLCTMKTKYGTVPKNTITKMYHIPQYLCCFTSQGLRDFGLQLFVFIQSEVKAQDLISLIEYCEKNFKISSQYDEIEPSEIGTIFLFGVNLLKKKLECYKLFFNENRILIAEKLPDVDGGGLKHITKPSHPNLNHQDIINNSKIETLNDVSKFFIKITEAQKFVFDQEAEPFIGGSIEQTIINFENDNYYTSSEIIHNFKDYKRD